MNEADVHLHRPAPVRFGQGGRLLAEFKPGTDGALAPVLAAHHHRATTWWTGEFVKRWTDASLLVVVEDMEPTGGRYRPVIACPCRLWRTSSVTKLKTRLLKGERPERGRQPHKFLCVEQERQRRRGRPVMGIGEPMPRKWEGCNHVAPRAIRWKSCTRNVAGRLSSPAVLLGAGGGRHIDFDLKGTHRDRAGRRHEVRCQARMGLPGGIREGVHYGVVPEKTGLDPALVEACLAWRRVLEGQNLRRWWHPSEPRSRPGGQIALRRVRRSCTLSYMTGNFDGLAGNRGILTRTLRSITSPPLPASTCRGEVKWTLKARWRRAITSATVPLSHLPTSSWS